MAVLESEETLVASALTLDLLVPEPGWVGYRLLLVSGDRRLVLEDPPEGHVEGRCLLAVEPVDEVELLCGRITTLLSGDGRAARFEPSEPNFTLEITRETAGFAAWAWIDAGNQLRAHSTWDGFGLRFFTDAERLSRFVADLRAERLQGV